MTKGYRAATNHFFIVNEWRAGDTPAEDYARDTIVDVTMNGITYSLISDSLPQAELMRVAEGLGK